MRIDVRQRGEVEVVDVSVASAGPAGDVTLEECLERLLAAGQTLFILNLTRGPAVDSAWLGELRACRERAREHHGTIKLVLTPQQLRVADADRLSGLFEIFQDEEDALDSCVPWYATNGIP